MKLHEKVRQYMNENQIKIKDVGEKTDIEIKRFYRIIAGDSKMTADELFEICEALNVNPNFFKNNFLETKINNKRAIKQKEVV